MPSGVLSFPGVKLSSCERGAEPPSWVMVAEVHRNRTHPPQLSCGTTALKAAPGTGRGAPPYFNISLEMTIFCISLVPS